MMGTTSACPLILGLHHTSALDHLHRVLQLLTELPLQQAPGGQPVLTGNYEQLLLHAIKDALAAGASVAPIWAAVSATAATCLGYIPLALIHACYGCFAADARLSNGGTLLHYALSCKLGPISVRALAYAAHGCSQAGEDPDARMTTTMQADEEPALAPGTHHSCMPATERASSPTQSQSRLAGSMEWHADAAAADWFLEDLLHGPSPATPNLQDLSNGETALHVLLRRAAQGAGAIMGHTSRQQHHALQLHLQGDDELVDQVGGRGRHACRVVVCPLHAALLPSSAEP